MKTLAVLAVALLLCGCDDKPAFHAEGTAECYQMGTLIWHGRVQWHGIWLYDADGALLTLPTGCITHMRLPTDK